MPKKSEQGFATLVVVIVVTAILSACILFILSLVAGDSNTGNKIVNLPLANNQTSNEQDCGQNCQQYIDSQINKLKEQLDEDQTLPKPSPSSSLIVLSVATPTPTTNLNNSSQPKEYYIYFGVNSSTIKTDWTDLAGSEIKFNTSNYPGAKKFVFQVNLLSDANDRDTFVRIFDSTHSVGVIGSEISYRGLSVATKESDLTFLSGNLNLKVQIKSLNGNLATITNPRIKIVY